MPWLILALRSILMITHAVWLGGFTFYGAAVIPVLHDELNDLDAGHITQRVSDRLNLIGLATLALWWALAWAERRTSPRLARRLRLGLLSATTVLLAFLAVDHEILDDRLARYGLAGFYAYHRVYLVASTIQWAVNLALVPATLAIWTRHPEASRPSPTA
jgi:hypothetical protein